MGRYDTTPPDLQTIGGRLKWARLQWIGPAGETLKSPRAAAKYFGWKENTYKSHEQGLRQSEGLKLETAERYARRYGVDIAWLTTGRGSPYAKTRVEPPPPLHPSPMARRA